MVNLRPKWTSNSTRFESFFHLILKIKELTYGLWFNSLQVSFYRYDLIISYLIYQECLNDFSSPSGRSNC